MTPRPDRGEVSVTNAEIAAAFEHVADLLEYQGENVFRVRAYRNAARTIRGMVESLSAIRVAPGRALTDIEGIGSDLAEKIGSLLETGALPLLSELQQQVPKVVFELMKVPGLGPKKARLLVEELGIDSLESLEKACRAGRVEAVKGFGPRTQAVILENIAFAKDPENNRILWRDADAVVQELLVWLRGCPAARQVEGAGSWRRGRETVGDIDIVVDSDDAASVMDRLQAWPGVVAVLLRGDTKTSVRGPEGVQIDLRVVPHDSFGAAWQYFTGSKEHNVRLRTRARERGLTINEYGVYRLTTGTTSEGRRSTALAGVTEESLYDAVGLPWIPPELREGRTRSTPPRRANYPH